MSSLLRVEYTCRFSKCILQIYLVLQVASRRVFQTAAVILVLMGVVTKFGAVMSLIPDPVLGGLNAVLLGTLVGVAIATLRFVDLTSQRNLTVMGLALLLGLSVPEWVNGSPGRINTGRCGDGAMDYTCPRCFLFL